MKIITLMTSITILKLLDFTKPFTIDYDASDIGISGTLIQEGHPIINFSDKLNQAK